MGLHPYVFKLLAFVISGFLATLGGIVYLLLIGRPASASPALRPPLSPLPAIGEVGSADARDRGDLRTRDLTWDLDVLDAPGLDRPSTRRRDAPHVALGDHRDQSRAADANSQQRWARITIQTADPSPSPLGRPCAGLRSRVGSPAGPPGRLEAVLRSLLSRVRVSLVRHRLAARWAAAPVLGPALLAGVAHADACWYPCGGTADAAFHLTVGFQQADHDGPQPKM